MAGKKYRKTRNQRQKPQGFGKPKEPEQQKEPNIDRLVAMLAREIVGDDPNLQDHFAVEPEICIKQAREMLGLSPDKED